jgi:metal-responsive CopG/Arc/MetJ family transcriptional regulator
MRTVQMTLEEELVDAVDRVAKKLGTTRSGFTREALRAALTRSKEREKERRHRDGYLRKPSRRGECEMWEGEQVWDEP